MFDIIMFWLTATALTYMTLLGPYVIILMLAFEWIKALTGDSKIEQSILNKIEKGFEFAMNLPMRLIGHDGQAKEISDLEGNVFLGSLIWAAASLVIVFAVDGFSGDISSRYVELIAWMSTWSAAHLGWLGLPLTSIIVVSVLYTKGLALYTRLMPTIAKIDELTKEKTDV